MADGFLLSPRDYEKIRELVRDIDNRRRNNVSANSHKEEDNPSPGTYIALSPTGGIAGRVGAIAGSAVCEIYRISRLNDQDELVKVGKTQRVLNIHADGIPGQVWFAINRDQYGSWLAEMPSEEDEGTGTGTGTAPHPITIYEYFILCEDGALNQYRKPIDLYFENSNLRKEEGEWEYYSTEGCCDCTGTGTVTPAPEGPTITCCGGPIELPGRIYGTFSNTSVECSCLEGMTLEFDYDSSVSGSGAYHYRSIGIPTGCTSNGSAWDLRIIVECIFTSIVRFQYWNYNGSTPYACGMTGFTEVEDCDILPISFTITSVAIMACSACSGGGGTDDADITFTETPP